MMVREELEYVEQSKSVDDSWQSSSDIVVEDTSQNRRDSRCVLESQAVVSISPISSRAGTVQEISRGGLFFGFRDTVTTAYEMEKAGIEVGASTEVAFAASIDGERHRFRVRGQIARISQQGIGIQFQTHNPPQLAALREFFASSDKESVAKHEDGARSLAARHRRLVKKAPDTSGWQDWDLVP